MKRIEYKINEKIGDCLYIREFDPHIRPDGRKERQAYFKCFCGNIFISNISNVKRKLTLSCGCLWLKRMKETFTIHGLSEDRLYYIWGHLKSRCYNENDPAYERYGGRGIKVYDKWKHDFKSFYNYVINMPNCNKKGYSIDRIDNDGNYEPENIRWADDHTQMANRRKSTNKTSKYIGVCWAKDKKKWRAGMLIRGNKIFLGYHKTEENAALARNKYILDNDLSEYPIQEIN